jgi:hypothetical protein
MMPSERRQKGLGRFSIGPPLYYSKEVAKKHGCDLAIPNGPGLGNLVLYSRLIHDMGWHFRRPLRLLSSPMKQFCGSKARGSSYPLWENNPFISEILNPNDVDREIEPNLLADKDDLCQFSHITENLCSAYEIPNRVNYGALYLTQNEMEWALRIVNQLPRPVICIHPAGKSSSLSGSPWYIDNWKKLLQLFSKQCSFLRVGVLATDQKDELDILWPQTSVRQLMSLVWASDIFIGFDSGPGHVATAFGKPAIILWDILRKRELEVAKEAGFETAMLTRWGYPQNDNILIYGDRRNESFFAVENRLRRCLGLFNR